MFQFVVYPKLSLAWWMVSGLIPGHTVWYPCTMEEMWFIY